MLEVSNLFRAVYTWNNVNPQERLDIPVASVYTV